MLYWPGSEHPLFIFLWKHQFWQIGIHRACRSPFQNRWSSEMGNTHSFFFFFLTHLVVLSLTVWSVCVISVLHASWKLCKSAAPMLAFIFLIVGCCGHVSQSALEGCFYEHWPILPNKGIPVVKWEGEGTLCAIHQGRGLFYRGGYFPATHFNLGFGLSA